ncbi:MAG: hypothetical protein K2W96_25585 [Gemmataceae bacterium]|nr:hypothetical protein [Gemmataceae bacterium]
MSHSADCRWDSASGCNGRRLGGLRERSAQRAGGTGRVRSSEEIANFVARAFDRS